MKAATLELANLSWLASPAALGERISRLATGSKRFRRRDHLEVFSDLLVDATFGRILAAIYNIPPQHGKTTLDGLWWPVWISELHARGILDRGEFIFITHEKNYAGLWGGRARDVIAENPTGELVARIDPSTESKTEWRTLAGGGMFSGGVKGGVTGRTGHFIAIDDPLRAREAQSAIARDEVWKFWLEDVVPRRHPETPVVYAGTRFHELDLPGRWKSPAVEYPGDPDEWVVVRLPALAEPKPEEPDPIGRERGEPLIRPDVEHTPEQAKAFLARQRETGGNYAWNGQWQQRPSEPEGTILRRAWWKQWRADRGDGPDPLAVKFMASVDCSFKDTKSSSWVVVGIWAYEEILRTDEHGNVLPVRKWLVDLVRARLNFPATKVLVRATRLAWPEISTIVVEEKANGIAILQELATAVAGLEPFNPDKYGSKEARAQAITGELQSGYLAIPEPGTEAPRIAPKLAELAKAEGVDVPPIAADWVGGFLDETGDFPDAAADDQVDMTTQAILWIREFAPLEPEVETGADLTW